ncbi:hypothetical protein [Phenylobacterium sp.]
MSRRSGKRLDARGAVAIEYALLLPAFLLLMACPRGVIRVQC